MRLVGRKVKKLMKRNIWQPLLFYVLLLFLWEIIYIFGVDILKIWKSYTIPSPDHFFHRAILLFGNSTIYKAVVASLWRIFQGFIISVILGTLLGLFMIAVPFFGRNIKPFILGLQTLPSICWVSFAILWYGLSQGAVIFVIVIGSMFSVAMSVRSCIENVNPLYLCAARTMGVEGRRLYTWVIFPASLPGFLTGLRQAWSFAWRALMSAEMMISMAGLGQALDSARNVRNDINEVMVIMVLIIILGTVIDVCIFQQVEKRLYSEK